METAHREQPSAARLGLWDTTSIIVGIIIGVGIFETPASIFAALPSFWGWPAPEHPALPSPATMTIALSR